MLDPIGKSGDWALRRPDAEGIRAARKACKRARAALRFAQDAGIGGAKALRQSVKAIAKELGRVRDAAVAREVAGAILPGRPLELGRAPAPSPAWWNARRRELMEIREALLVFPFDRISRREVKSALRRTLDRARKAERRAKRKGTPETIHGWRKRAMLLRHQLGLLRGDDDRAEPVYKRLKKVTSRLGKATDCRALGAALQGSRRVDRPSKRRLQAGMAKRQRQGLEKAQRSWSKARRAAKHYVRKLC